MKKYIKYKKVFLAFFSVVIVGIMVLSGCNYKEEVIENSKVGSEQDVQIVEKQYAKMSIDTQIKYQTIESFGTSGAWWSQYVGGWDQPYNGKGEPVREEIAKLLFDKEQGIGLTSYRYNIGAGSTSGKSKINDQDRRAQSFEVAPFEYDWDRDAKAVWFLNEAVELGVEEVILFSNSPLERLTISGMAHGAQDEVRNLDPQNYEDFATYILDVAEHFVQEGIPVKYVSPINEPQWGWSGGQEGGHYETKEIVDIYKVFVTELEKRETLREVELSGPESGEWGGKTKEYVSAILRDEQLKEHFTTIDNHSYWTQASTKKDFKLWMDTNFPNVKLRMSEWCEMVNGRDFTMDSAFNLAEEVFDDLTILDVVSWQTWVAISPGEYRDGVIYVNKDKKAYRPAKRLWGYGNFTKFIRPGYQRVFVKHNYKDIYDLKTVAFKGPDELVIVIINRGEKREFQLDLGTEKDFNKIDIYTTTEQKDLECTYSNNYNNEQIIDLEAESISTIVLK
ncbi:MAG: glycoside hydrolase family 30 protein [Cellulosilyticaceae bacterium]